MSNVIWSEIVKAAISLLVMVLAATVPLGWRWFSAHFTANQLLKAKGFAEVAIRAAEQISGAANWTDEQKYSYAARFLNDLAAKAGITLDETQIKPLIEAAVHDLNAWEKSFAPIPMTSGTLHTVEAVSALPDLTAQINDAITASLKTVVWTPVIPATT